MAVAGLHFDRKVIEVARLGRESSPHCGGRVDIFAEFNMSKKRIVVMGGGTAGASAVALLQAKLSDVAEITLIDSAEYEPVGVGEATVGNINAFLRMCDLDPFHTCLGAAEGTIKNSVHLKDWFQPGHSYFTPIGSTSMEYHDFLRHQRPESEYWDSWTGLRLARRGKAVFLKPEFIDALPLPPVWPEYAFNIDAHAFARKLIDVGLQNGATHIRKTIAEVVTAGDDAISHLVLEDGQRIDADFFVDCSGFQRLIPKALGLQITRFTDIPNNRAWATRIPYVDRERELPYLACVECQTMAAGWRWQIGLKHRIGTGYVFSSDYLSEENALNEFMGSFDGDRIAADDCQLIRFETACYARQGGTNWITCGLSAGFVEPLESTSIFFMHNNLVSFLNLMCHNQMPAPVQMVSTAEWDSPTGPGSADASLAWSQESIDRYNYHTFHTFRTTVEYVAAHYAFSTLDRSDYWNDWRGQRQRYLDITSNVLGYGNQDLYFSRPAFSLLCVGNQLGAVENWDLSRLILLDRQRPRWMSGELSSPRAVLDDRTRDESLQAEVEYLGGQLCRSYLADLFSQHAFDLIDQHQWLAHFDERRSDELTRASIEQLEMVQGQW